MNSAHARGPERDWYVILSCFALTLVAVVAINGYIFWVFSKPAETPAAESLETVSLSRSDITKATQKLRDRDAGASILPSAVRADPSL